MDDTEKYEILKKEVDSLQIQLSQERGPWYSKSSNLISVIALLFSFGTTIVSAINSHNEDIRANHREAIAIIQRITNLPIENFELMEAHKGSAPGEALSGFVNQENILLATQAANLIKRYPNSFNSTEFMAVATALANSNITDKVPSLLRSALDKADTSNDYVVAMRSYGEYLFSVGIYVEGRKHFQQALKVWDKFPEKNMFVVNSFDVVTLVNWAQAEIMTGNLRQAEEIIDQAKARLSQLPSGTTKESLQNRINFTSGFLKKGTQP